MRILIVDSDPPALSERARQTRGASNADRFEIVLSELRPRAERVVVAPYAGKDAAFEGADGAVFTGSSVDWAVDDARGAPVAEAMEQALAQDIPIWGSCNGMQLAAVLLGGAVGDAPAGFEAGLALNVGLTTEGASHPMMAGRRERYAAPCIHRHEVTRLPEGAAHLARNAHSEVQAFACETGGISVWGTQYHPEYTAHMPGAALAQIAGTDPSLVANLMAADTDPAAVHRLGADPADLEPDARTIELRNWLAMLEARMTGN